MDNHVDSNTGAMRMTSNRNEVWPGNAAWRRARYWALAAGMAMLASACTRTAPEQALRDTVAAMQQHIASRDASALHALIDEEFVGPEGMDRRGARQMATVTMLRHRSVGVTSGPLDLQLQGDDRASVRTTVVLTGGSGAALPDSARAYRIDSAWRRRGDDWRLLSLHWEPVGR